MASYRMKALCVPIFLCRRKSIRLCFVLWCTLWRIGVDVQYNYVPHIRRWLHQTDQSHGGDLDQPFIRHCMMLSLYCLRYKLYVLDKSDCKLSTEIESLTTPVEWWNGLRVKGFRGRRCHHGSVSPFVFVKPNDRNQRLSSLWSRIALR